MFVITNIVDVLFMVIYHCTVSHRWYGCVIVKVDTVATSLLDEVMAARIMYDSLGQCCVYLDSV